MTQIRAALRRLGLTEYGARAYEALVALGPSPADVVASAGPVPRTKIYAVLAELARRGWVDADPGRPRRYRARRPRECVDRERGAFNALVDAALPSLEASFTDRGSRFAGQLWLLAGAEAVSKRGLEMVTRARSSVALVASFPLPGDDGALARALRAASRRGARVRLVVPDPEAPHARALAQAAAEVRVAMLPPRALLVDGEQALIAFPDASGGRPDARGVWNPSHELVDLMGGLLEQVWASAAPLDEGVAPRARAKRG